MNERKKKVQHIQPDKFQIRNPGSNQNEKPCY